VRTCCMYALEPASYCILPHLPPLSHSPPDTREDATAPSKRVTFLACPTSVWRRWTKLTYLRRRISCMYVGRASYISHHTSPPLHARC
jgi:hypothetical protein